MICGLGIVAFMAPVWVDVEFAFWCASLEAG